MIRHSSLLLLLALPLVAACDVAVGPPAVTGSVRISVPGNQVVVFRQPRLYAYPHANVTRLDVRDDYSRVEFRSSAGLFPAFRDLQLQLRSRGWERSRYRERRDRIEATFVQGRARLTVDLRDRGRDGYRLELRSR
jgi:hypothetical protein